MPNNKILQLLCRACFMLLIPSIQVFYFVLNNYRSNVKALNIFIDDIIPFNKYFIMPYIYWYIYVFAILVFFLFVDYKSYYRLIACIVSGTLICFVIYYFYPTTVFRPEISGNDLFSNLVRTIYASDNPYNCFPSLHVLDAVLPTLFLVKYSKSRLVGAFAVTSCVSIILSTVFVKQHYILDAVSAIILATAMYMLYTSEYIWSRVKFKRIAAFLQLVKEKSPVKDQ